ncbi:transaldolase [Kribbella shirazensis]|uniref:Transaldolase n=1 Tax=Kribbella shirazensis TaxID=1105143 RepID=A0A7X5VHU8_9ACTN|nr:transaldolase [Kribbella shirazensis]NIK61334.1 transaldolase [Kribbella shirazensis]
MANLLSDLRRRGVSVWLDDLHRAALLDGTLTSLMRQRSVTGVTSNPAIFARSIIGSPAYDDQLKELRRRGVSVDEARRALTTWDVRAACDLFRALYEQTDDGLVSIEVDPRFAYDPDATLADARALWWQVDRPNLLVKIPATRQSLPAIAACLAEGISVNVTLIFSAQRYAEVFDTFVDGMTRAAEAGHDLRRIASVASLFVSRVDTAVDQLLQLSGHPGLRGRAGLANARRAAGILAERIQSADWGELRAAGARPQRLLWASTGVKDPAYDATRYLSGLAVAGTINTMPLATLEAAAARHAAPTPDEAWPDPGTELRSLTEAGVELEAVMTQLEIDGVEAFSQAWSSLGEAIARRLVPES